MLEGVQFSYNGQLSTNLGLINVRINQKGMFEETFIPSREIVEIDVSGKSKPYFQDIKKKPLEFQLSFAFENGFDNNKLRKVARCFDVDYYKVFWTTSNPNRWYYCMPTGDSGLFHNGLEQGYITLTMRCDSPYSYSPFITTDVYDFSNNPIKSTLRINNDGDIPLKPELFITKIGNGNVSIVNNENMLSEFKFENLANDETIYINNEREHIDSDIPRIYRYDNFNGNYLELPLGDNILSIYGNCKIKLRYQLKYLQG